MKIMIIGAGNIGISIAYMLANNDYDITIADSDLKKLSNNDLKLFKKTEIDILKTPNLQNIFKKMDYIINAGPYFLASKIAQIAKEAQTHYFDLTEDTNQTEKIKQIAKNSSKTVFVPQCGLAPGFIGILANYLAQDFDKIYDVKMRVGALPKYPTNNLKYNMTWSTDGLINEYLHPCYAIKNKQLVMLEPLEGYETFIIDGDEYEAFNTSGGLGTLCDTWKNNVNSMDYKTVRYINHCKLMKFLINDLQLGKNDGKKLKEIFNSSIPKTEQDMVLIFVSVNGIKNKKYLQKTWTKKIYHTDMFNKQWTAIQLTTAAGVCNMIELHRNNKIPQTGFVKQEDANFNDFIESKFGYIYT